MGTVNDRSAVWTETRGSPPVAVGVTRTTKPVVEVVAPTLLY